MALQAAGAAPLGSALPSPSIPEKERASPLVLCLTAGAVRGVAPPSPPPCCVAATSMLSTLRWSYAARSSLAAASSTALELRTAARAGKDGDGGKVCMAVSVG